MKLNSGGQFMKSKILQSVWIFCMVTVLSLLLNQIGGANTDGKPVVIRKKIAAPTTRTPGNINRSNVVPDQMPGMPEPKSEVSILRHDSAAKTIAGAAAVGSRRLRPLYNPSGKTDPFKPLIKETPKVKSESGDYADTDHRGTTALEKIDLSQLRLTGVILAASGNRGLVREACGRGHVISTGTPIGIHRGRVAGVLKDRVIVKEKMKDSSGKFFFKETELKLNKRNG
jgi:Tfp pilus assembly protein PilP